MPVRSLQQSVLRWPRPEEVLAEVETWALAQRDSHPDLTRVGVFGSYGRGDASVGSDLDLLLVDESATGAQSERLRHWPLEQLPLSCDALVLTSVELESLLASGSRMAQELKRDLRWIL
ncbi:MAG: nucleotidyltransferase domain-containing protein [Vulcanococcus sp.]